jgi:UDP-glucose 4-epimerase
VLLTGLSTYWGGRLAQTLEQDSRIEAIVGVDSAEPAWELGRTEFVQVSNRHALIERLIEGARIDTVIDTRLVVDGGLGRRQEIHENNVIGTMNILAACATNDSPVRRFVFKSSGHYYGCEQDDPAFFTEDMRRTRPPRTQIERDLVEAEVAVAEYGARHPATEVTVLRCANVLGPGVRTSHTRLFELPLVPIVLGFDPRYQFVHPDDVVRALEHVVIGAIPGTFNVAADGVLALTEVISLLGKRPAPLLPPFGTGLALGPLRALGLPIPAEMRNQLRFGRGLDNRLLKATGFSYRLSTRETVLSLAGGQRLEPIRRGAEVGSGYERGVEAFLSRSSLVQRKAPATEPPGDAGAPD